MTQPKPYRKKPVVIEAMQWDGSAEGATPIIDWILKTSEQAARYHSPTPRADGDGEWAAAIAIDTLEGTMSADSKDWVIRGVQGEFYPCKPDIFEVTYEAV